jgi:D-alanyl-D-alanine carboxypeptidase/D-alanyl-D-alanine-endopeptidase (penicillin-binding protein 4)
MKIERPPVLIWLLLTCAAARAGLQQEIDIAIRSPVLPGSTVAVSVRDAGTDQELVAIEALRPMIPASNMKLLTGGAALHILGPGFRFRTQILRDGDRLVVVGDGDPAFADPDLLALTAAGDSSGIDIEGFLRLLSGAVRDAGMEHVSELVVDDRIFDRQFVHPSWPIDQLNRGYCAEVAGLNFHLNVLHVFPRPTGGARPDLSRLAPAAPFLVIRNQATTQPEGTSSAWIARPPASNDLTVYGNVRHEYREPVAVTLHDPGLFFANVLADRLKAAGVTVGPQRVAAAGDPPSSGQPVGPVISTPIATALARCNRDSENLYAEALLKRMAFAVTGEPGSWSNGAALVRHVMHDRLDRPALLEGVVVSDGSGLSRENRCSAAAMTAWLVSFHHDSDLGPVFGESLPTAGREGTLRQRFQGTDLAGMQVQGKSGYINGVSCLSGYVTAPGGPRRAFSVLVNGLRPADVRAAKELQERIVGLVARDMAAPAMTLGGGE